MNTNLTFELKPVGNNCFEIINFSSDPILPDNLVERIKESVSTAINDYNKPFNSQNLPSEDLVPDVIDITPELIYDTRRRILSVKNMDLVLTTKEGEVFQYLAIKVNQMVERSYILQKVWEDNNYYNSRSMDVYLTKLRKYIKPINNVSIVNHHGKGYSLQILKK